MTTGWVRVRSKAIRCASPVFPLRKWSISNRGIDEHCHGELARLDDVECPRYPVPCPLVPRGACPPEHAQMPDRFSEDLRLVHFGIGPFPRPFRRESLQWSRRYARQIPRIKFGAISHRFCHLARQKREPPVGGPLLMALEISACGLLCSINDQASCGTGGRHPIAYSAACRTGRSSRPFSRRDRPT